MRSLSMSSDKALGLSGSIGAANDAKDKLAIELMSNSEAICPLWNALLKKVFGQACHARKPKRTKARRATCFALLDFRCKRKTNEVRTPQYVVRSTFGNGQGYRKKCCAACARMPRNRNGSASEQT